MLPCHSDGLGICGKVVLPCLIACDDPEKKRVGEPSGGTEGKRHQSKVPRQPGRCRRHGACPQQSEQGGGRTQSSVPCLTRKSENHHGGRDGSGMQRRKVSSLLPLSNRVTANTKL
ncbi:hypothetical protein AVEN_135655-1 [Araneus ventricosus]|uniref:Uncharacterized protein n=1 Tax=Araneus ventricosus TaxID=182803 RepID=A0A4Y2EKH3_ARAVE|nr:hypothetical protein AVEN_135655-1 [Araneus ventricosus]